MGPGCGDRGGNVFNNWVALGSCIEYFKPRQILNVNFDEGIPNLCRLWSRGYDIRNWAEAAPAECLRKLRDD